MELSVEDPEQLSKDFPSQSKDEKSEGEISDEEQFESQNNNATVGVTSTQCLACAALETGTRSIPDQSVI